MMATDSIELDTTDEKTSASSIKKPTRGKRALQTTNSNGIMENGNSSLTESTSPVSSRRSANKKTTESNLETSTESKLTEPNSNRTTYQLNQTLTPVESSQPDERNRENAQKFEQIELNVLTDEDDGDDRVEQKQKIQPKSSTLTEHSTVLQSYTSSDNDVIEIHQFSLADIDAYLDIYFETLDNRLRHLIGEDEQLQQFRLAMKNRIHSNTNSLEYQNVLLGKMNGEVVSAVTLAFHGDQTTVTNDNILPQTNSCLTSMHRWIVRNANYIPASTEECYIEMIGVKSPYRKHGIGAAMLECIEHFARQAEATSLTIHINGEELRNYFQRSGFDIDHTDNSAFWKWVAERQSIQKMSKPILPGDGDADYSLDNTNSYIDESMAGSEVE